MAFKYSYDLQSKSYLPLVEVLIYGPKENLNVKVLVDSGATFTILPNEIARRTGYKLSAGKIKTVMFGSGPQQSTELQVSMLVDSQFLKNVDVLFVESLPFGYGLLGRNCVFSKFNEIAFVERALKLDFRK